MAFSNHFMTFRSKRLSKNKWHGGQCEKSWHGRMVCGIILCDVYRCCTVWDDVVRLCDMMWHNCGMVWMWFEKALCNVVYHKLMWHAAICWCTRLGWLDAQWQNLGKLRSGRKGKSVSPSHHSQVFLFYPSPFDWLALNNFIHREYSILKLKRVAAGLKTWQ